MKFFPLYVNRQQLKYCVLAFFLVVILPYFGNFSKELYSKCAKKCMVFLFTYIRARSVKSRLCFYFFLVTGSSDRMRKEMENYPGIVGNIMRKKATIMRKKRQIMRKFLKLIKLFPWLFPTYKIQINVLPRISVLYGMFDILLPFVDRYFFVQHSFP